MIPPQILWRLRAPAASPASKQAKLMISKETWIMAKQHSRHKQVLSGTVKYLSAVEWPQTIFACSSANVSLLTSSILMNLRFLRIMMLSSVSQEQINNSFWLLALSRDLLYRLACYQNSKTTVKRPSSPPASREILSPGSISALPMTHRTMETQSQSTSLMTSSGRRPFRV